MNDSFFLSFDNQWDISLSANICMVTYIYIYSTLADEKRHEEFFSRVYSLTLRCSHRENKEIFLLLLICV